MHPSMHASTTPNKAAIIMAESGKTIDFVTLEAMSNQAACGLRALGLKRGDVVATLFDNLPEVLIFGLAAQRAGLYLTSVSNKLSPTDIAYVVEDCGARMLVASDKYLPLAEQALFERSSIPLFGWSSQSIVARSWTEMVAPLSTTAIADESPGTDMLYSSGTTGRPKGVKFPLPEGGIDHQTPLMTMGTSLYDMGSDTVYLSTSPLYHAAPLRWAMTTHRLGGTVVVMERFDAERALESRTGV